MSDKKIGNQLPTQSVTLPYKKSLGDEAVKIYSKTGRTAQEWQELLLQLNDPPKVVHCSTYIAEIEELTHVIL